MNENIKNKLEEANKLIFIKKYKQAALILDRAVQLQEGRGDLLVHLRRIELAARLNSIVELRDQYVKEIGRKKIDPQVGSLCIALAEQHGELVPALQSIQRFNEIMENNGESAAAYFGIALSLENQGHLERAIYNYEQSLKKDMNWYPSYFGLSQIFYSKNDHTQGDYYFYLFEKFAPFNLYGNFETHKTLCEEFLQKRQFEEAEVSITSLSDWWIENRGQCPVEIQIYEAVALCNIAKAKDDHNTIEQYRARAITCSELALQEENYPVDALYFIAKIMEDFGEPNLAFQFFRKILKHPHKDQAMVQRIGNQLFSFGEYKIAYELFREAYEHDPDNAELKFCFLIAQLKLERIEIEKYLSAKEKVQNLIEGEGDKTEVLSILHNLTAKFQLDPDVQGCLGDLYLGIGHIEKAAQYYEKMYQLDRFNFKTNVKYASFLVSHGDLKSAKEVLDFLDERVQKKKQDPVDVYWLKSNYYTRLREYAQAYDFITKALEPDPWNLSYLVQEIICKTNLVYPHDEEKVSMTLQTLLTDDLSGIDWMQYDRLTQQIANDHHGSLVYARNKLFFLFNNGNESFESLLEAARRFDPSKGINDLLRLINTNFDSHLIYFGLAMLFKEQWQLETASMWLEHVLRQQPLPNRFINRAHVELADCYVWRKVNSAKAVEYLKIAMESDNSSRSETLTILTHAYLKVGQVREAQFCLENLDKEARNFETSYLEGLLHYRNGNRKKAKSVWKPLLTFRCDNLRYHNIKQEIMRFYFDGETYMKAV